MIDNYCQNVITHKFSPLVCELNCSLDKTDNEELTNTDYTINTRRQYIRYIVKCEKYVKSCKVVIL